MTHVTITDSGKLELLSKKMVVSGARAVEAMPVLEEISVDMIRVTNLLWRSQGRRGGGMWKALAPDTVKRKGTSRILYTAGSDPRYTPHKGSNILAKSVTKLKGAHQILHVDNNSIVFGTDIVYAKRQFNARPFIRFTAGDERRWNKMIAGWIVEPFTTPL